MYNFVTEITAWDQENFHKLLFVNSIYRAIPSYRLKLFHEKKKPCVNMVQKHHPLWAKAHLKGSEAKWKLVCGQTNHNLNFFFF